MTPMLTRLQKKTLIPAQFVGYALTLLVGVIIVMLAFQLYSDVKPLLTQQTDVFKNHAVTMSKTVNILKTFNKDAIYFSDEEIDDISGQPFVKEVARFSSSSFNTMASISLGDIDMSTELFFESIPDKYVDVDPEKWHWDESSDFIPIVIPEDYLNLYNFGFAESQSLPVVSQSAIETVRFNVRIIGNGKRHTYKGGIVGFSSKINTILAPEAFLRWANMEYGAGPSSQPSRLLVEFYDASDERIPAFINDNGYSLKQDELESSKMTFFFRLGLVFVLIVALIIIILSVAFIIMSLNLIVQKNRDLFVNLYNIGYSPKQMARFYQRTVSIITVADMAVAMLIAILIRDAYVGKLSTIFEIEGGIAPIAISAAALTITLVIVYNIIVLRTIRNFIRSV